MALEINDQFQFFQNVQLDDDGNLLVSIVNGVSTFTGGTIDNLTVTGSTILNSLTAQTIYSGGTNLYDIFLTTADGNDITRVQPGSNITTGGTDNFPIVSLASSPSVNNLTFSGTAIGGTIQAGAGTFTSLSAGTLSAGTIVSDSLLWEDKDGSGVVVSTKASTVSVAGNTNGLAHGEDLTMSDSLNSAIIGSSDSIIRKSDESFIAGSIGSDILNTERSAIIASNGVTIGVDTGTSTGERNSIISSYNSDILATGSVPWNVSNNSIIASSGSTIQSNRAERTVLIGMLNYNSAAPGVHVENLYITSGATSDYVWTSVDSSGRGEWRINTSAPTYVQPGINTTTGGTANAPTVNVVDSPAFNNITFSGTAIGGNISAGSVSATTFYSGSTNLQSIISTVNSRLAEGISTGIISGGTLSINAGDNTKFDIAAGLGYIVDYTVYPQSTQLLSWATQTGLTVTNLATSFATDVAINAAGTVLQQNSYTREELRSIIFLGGLDHSTLTSIRNIFKITVPTYGVGSSVKDLTLALGDINLDGNIFSSNGVNLKINKSAGSTFSYGRNYQNNQNDPNVISQSATTQQVFRHAFNNGSGTASFQAQGTDINPNSYDDGSGTPQTVPNNKYTIQRILMFSNSQNVFVQYGQTVYNTKDEAIANLAAASYTNLSGLKTAMVRGYLIVKQGSTTLSTSDTVFVNGDRFGGIGGGSGVAAANYYTTGATVSGTSVIFDRNDLASAYSVNLSAMTGNVNVSGNFSATTLFSGSTNLYSIFSTTDTNDITRVQPGSNISTGGTANAPTISLAASPSVNNLTFSGTAIGGTVQAGAGTFTSLSATTLSGGTILSGSTNLYSIFAKTTDIPTAYAYDFMAAASDETTAITTGTSKVTFYAPRTFTLTGVTATLTTSGSTTTTVDVKYNGSSVFATPISLASGVFYATTATTTSAITKYGKFTVDLTAAGTNAKGIKIILEGRTSA